MKCNKSISYTQNRDIASPRDATIFTNIASATLAILTLYAFCNNVWCLGFFVVEVLLQVGT